jgi:hypothetical protein
VLQDEVIRTHDPDDLSLKSVGEFDLLIKHHIVPFMIFSTLIDHIKRKD